MFIAVFWGCGPKYSLLCLLQNLERKLPKRFLYRERNQLKSRNCCWWSIQRRRNRSITAILLFYLTLAEEYMMTKLTKKCENYLMDHLNWPARFSFGLYLEKTNCLWLLEIAHDYRLDSLHRVCIERAKAKKLGIWLWIAQHVPYTVSEDCRGYAWTYWEGKAIQILTSDGTQPWTQFK